MASREGRFGISIRLVWLVLLLAGLAGYLIGSEGTGAPSLLRISLAALFVTCWIALALRLVLFRKRLVNFFRRLLANDYTTGIKVTPWLNDEVHAIVSLGNRVADQLRAYDRLRADRTALSYRTMDLVFRTVDQPILLANMEKALMRLNPQAQALFGVSQDSYGFDALEPQEANTRFFRQFLLVALRDKGTREGETTLQMPANDSVREIHFRMIPMRDESETVRWVVVFLKQLAAAPDAGQTPGADAPGTLKAAPTAPDKGD